MSGFDPDKFLSGAYDSKPKQAKADSFDPDKFLAGGYDTEKPSKKGSTGEEKAQTALENYGDTMTMGYLPQLQAGAEKVMTPILNVFTGNDVKSDGYIESRDKNRKRIEELSAENPKSAVAGKVAGILNQAPILAAKAVQGAGAAKKIYNAAKVGAAYGSAQNPGDIEGELSPVQLKDRAYNAGVGAVTGVVAQGLVEGAPVVAKAAKGAAGWLKEKAERAAFKALGPYARDALKAADRGEIEAIGRVLIDKGILKGAPNYETIAARAKEATGKTGAELEAIIEELSTKGDDLINASGGTRGTPAVKGMKAGAPEGGVDKELIAEHIRKKMINPNTEIPGVLEKNAKVEKAIETYLNNGKRFRGLSENERLKRSIGGEIKWDRLPGTEIPWEEQINRELYSATRQGSEDMAEAVASKVGGEMPEKFRDAKKTFGALSKASEIAEKRAAKEGVNRFISPTDYLTGTAGMAYGASQGDDFESKLTGAVMGAGVGLANRTLRTRGNPVVAKSLDAAADALLKIPKMAAIAKRNPELFNSVVQRLGIKRQQGAFESIPEQVEKLYLSAEAEQNGAEPKESADVPLKGYSKWAQSGATKLGLDPELAEKLMQSKEGKRLLIEASDLPEGSKKLESILNQISRGDQYGSGSSTSPETEILHHKRSPSSGR